MLHAPQTLVQASDSNIARRCHKSDTFVTPELLLVVRARDFRRGRRDGLRGGWRDRDG
jgi:hypothetical protein